MRDPRSPERHVHVIEYPSACTGCEHLAAAFVAAAPDWMLVGRLASPETPEAGIDVERLAAAHLLDIPAASREEGEP